MAWHDMSVSQSDRAQYNALELVNGMFQDQLDERAFTPYKFCEDIGIV